ncbi:glycosyltransferase [Luminiphilus sp.]|nr:glycosyltransferase [Luminiphilus sp.]
MTETSTRQPDFSGKSVALVVAGLKSEAGGAEKHYQGLCSGLLSLGVHVDIVRIPAEEGCFEDIISNYDIARNTDLSSYDAVISTKAPSYAVRHNNHAVHLIHTIRVFDDLFEMSFPNPSITNFCQRKAVHDLDFEAFRNVKAIFTNGNQTATRLYKKFGLATETIHPALEDKDLFFEKDNGRFLLPGRLHDWKRVDLAVKAVLASSEGLHLDIVGSGEAEERLKSLASGDQRIAFHGHVDEAALHEMYRQCRAVLFPTHMEDFGYITIEAFLCGKPVITCSDSGEPAKLVCNDETGLVVQPDPYALVAAMERLWNDASYCRRLGENALKYQQQNSWKDIAARLLSAALTGKSTTNVLSQIKTTVFDMQPIEPPIGGGRLRLLGLYHGLGSDYLTRYIGSYDWPGEPHRQLRLSDTLTEITIPLSIEHHTAAAELAKEANGKTVIDVAFSKQAMLSPAYVETAISEIRDAEVIIFSHPWVYPLVKAALRPDHLVIYDSQNVESYLRSQLLDTSNPTEEALVKQVAQDEYELGKRADWVLACSHDDLLRFNRVYGIPLDKMRVVPNGVMAFFSESAKVPKTELRTSLGISGLNLVAIFIGSPYGPNIDAARFIESELAPRMRDVDFVIAGGVGEGEKSTQPNVIYTGRLEDSDRAKWLDAADIAVNPMMAGSGTNIKMFDFMAASLPVVSTAIGARGIDTGGRDAILIAEPDLDSFCSAVDRLRDQVIRTEAGKNGRLCVEEGYSWERISEQLGIFIASRVGTANQSRPLFSVVIPTYERHKHLNKLFGNLSAQVDRDFEVIVVDQSQSSWLESAKDHGFMMTYYHSPIKGAVRARNTGAMLAQGKIIAFIDDDCIPDPEWLLNARPYFKDNSVLGLEGIIESDHLEDPAWRSVTNVGFEGIGFMTANLFVRSSVFQFLGGFDLQFDNPHFREDTDLGWRLTELGKVPYSKDVKVFHPAQNRTLDRESHQARNAFFEKDALLAKKHPNRFHELFLRESHYNTTTDYLNHLQSGFNKYKVEIPSWLEDYLS